MTVQSRYQKEYDALPAWAKKMVDAVTGGGLVYQSVGVAEHTFASSAPVFSSSVAFKKEKIDAWTEGLDGLVALACALSAPWPPPPSSPHKSMTTTNLVEMMSDGDDCAFDQPCHFGYRVEAHAVYCHCDAWPDAPRKCRRDRDNFRHEDCPGYVPNMEK